MKFNCGPSFAERYQAAYERKLDKRNRLQNWHSYFTWWPTRIGKGDCRWLEYIERKGTYHENHYYGSSTWWTWEYREKQPRFDISAARGGEF